MTTPYLNLKMKTTLCSPPCLITVGFHSFVILQYCELNICFTTLWIKIEKNSDLNSTFISCSQNTILFTDKLAVLKSLSHITCTKHFYTLALISIIEPKLWSDAYRQVNIAQCMALFHYGHFIKGLCNHQK